MKPKHLIYVILISLVIAGAACAAAKVQDALPAKGAVKGFGVMPKSLAYGKGDNISSIYDGGYEVYTKAGVIDAARQMYQRGNDYVEVTVHAMKSPKAALDFLRYWQKENKVKSLTKGKLSTSFVITKPSAAVYFVTGAYFTTATAFYPADKATRDLAGFEAVIEKRIVSSNKK